MYKSVPLIVAMTMFTAVAGRAETSLPPEPDGLLQGNEMMDVSAQVRIYRHRGVRFCFYPTGWHGPGWYRCGFAWRRGLGWGGVYGWNNWDHDFYGPRFGGSFRFGTDERRRHRVESRRDHDMRSGPREERRRGMSDQGGGQNQGATIGSGVTGSGRTGATPAPIEPRGGAVGTTGSGSGSIGTSGRSPAATMPDRGGGSIGGGAAGSGGESRSGGAAGGGTGANRMPGSGSQGR